MPALLIQAIAGVLLVHGLKCMKLPEKQVSRIIASCPSARLKLGYKILESAEGHESAIIGCFERLA